MFHEQVKFSFSFNHRRHVMVIRQRHALVRRPFTKSRDIPRINLDLRFIKFRFGGQRLGAIALNTTRHLAIDDARRTDSLEQRHLRRNAGLVLFHVAFQQGA